MRPIALALIAVLAAGCMAPSPGVTTSSTGTPPTPAVPPPSSAACPDPHWHATFAIFLPGPDGSPQRVDFAAPRTADGAHYYDLASAHRGGDPLMDVSVHLHQSGGETGSSDLGPAQVHMESRGVCMSLKATLHVLEADAGPANLTLFGGHAQVAGQSGTWTAAGGATLRFWVESYGADGAWAWKELSYAEAAPRQLRDGERLVVAFGAYTDAHATAMQQAVPLPITRA